MMIRLKNISTFVITFLLVLSFFSIVNVDYSYAADGCVIAARDVEGDTSLSHDYFTACTSIEVDKLGFRIPSLGDILTFVVRIFFVVAGLAALIYLLLGAFAWITSGGDKDSITAAREKIQAAVVGLILIVAVLAIIWTLEQVVFKRRICVGLSCPLTVPGLIESANFSNNEELVRRCCACLDQNGIVKESIDPLKSKCNPDGTVSVR